MKLKEINLTKAFTDTIRLSVSSRGDPAGRKLEMVAEAGGRMLLVTRIRWILIALLCGYGLYAGSLLICSQSLESIDTAKVAALAGTLLAAVILNLFYYLFYRELSHYPLVNLLQILLDIVLISVITYYGGGIFSPFWPVYAILSLEAALLLESKRGVWAMCVVSSLAFGIIVLTESVSVVPATVIPISVGAPRLDAMYRLLIWTWVSTLTAAVGIIGLTVSGMVRRRESALRELVVKDQMTNLYNRSYFYRELNSEIQRSKRYGRVFSVILLDIDDFKKFNDTFGHLEGDRLLKDFAGILRGKARRSETDPSYDIDVPCRYGGEEFAVILPETPARPLVNGNGGAQGANAVAFAERIRQEVGALSIHGARISVSVGVATFPEHGTTADDLVRAADEALYLSKREGKNRTIVAASGRGKPQNGISSSGLKAGSSNPCETPIPASSDTLPPP